MGNRRELPALLALCLFASVALGAARETVGGDTTPDQYGAITDIKLCPRPAAMVGCSKADADACDAARCAADPTATCTVKSCYATYRGQSVRPCVPIWTDEAGTLVACDKPVTPGGGGGGGSEGGGSEGGGSEGGGGGFSIGEVDDITKCGVPTVSALCLPEAMASCNGAVCSEDESATCIVKTCAAVYRGQMIRPCKPYWTNSTGDLVSCSPRRNPDVGDIEDIEDCPDKTIMALCTSPSWNACDTATCPNYPDAACTVKACAAWYRNVYLAPCTTLWYNKDTGDLINNCGSSGGGSGGGGVSTDGLLGCVAANNCTKKYEPVCGRDRRTYPNECSAKCAGVEVARAGKCQHCKGDTCKWATKDDVCMLGTDRQCWWKKYNCGGSSSLNPRSGLGTCQFKP